MGSMAFQRMKPKEAIKILLMVTLFFSIGYPQKVDANTNTLDLIETEQVHVPPAQRTQHTSRYELYDDWLAINAQGGAFLFEVDSTQTWTVKIKTEMAGFKVGKMAKGSNNIQWGSGVINGNSTDYLALHFVANSSNYKNASFTVEKGLVKRQYDVVQLPNGFSFWHNGRYIRWYGHSPAKDFPLFVFLDKSFEGFFTNHPQVSTITTPTNESKTVPIVSTDGAYGFHARVKSQPKEHYGYITSTTALKFKINLYKTYKEDKVNPVMGEIEVCPVNCWIPPFKEKSKIIKFSPPPPPPPPPPQPVIGLGYVYPIKYEGYFRALGYSQWLAPSDGGSTPSMRLGLVLQGKPLDQDFTWSAQSLDSWITVNPTTGTKNQSFVITATPQNTAAFREGKVKIKVGQLERTIEVYQYKRSDYEGVQFGTDKNTMNFSADGGNQSIQVSTQKEACAVTMFMDQFNCTVKPKEKFPWIANEDAGWIKVVPAGDSFTITVDPNNNAQSREAVVSVYGATTVPYWNSIKTFFSEYAFDHMVTERKITITQQGKP